jgi:hypothetical protein
MQYKVNKDLDYIVYHDFNVSLMQETNSTESQPLFFIKSKWFKYSGGQGLYSYYENLIYDKNHNLLEDNTIKHNGFECFIETKELWREVKGNSSSVTLKIKVSDKIGNTIEKIIDVAKIPKIRFHEIFHYLKLINEYGTHQAVEKIKSLELEIVELKDNFNK